MVGNPTNPTSVLHTREELLALRRPGRILVVDEAFADSVPGEPESLAGDCLPDVLVLRSLTKTWSLAGLRWGYALGARTCWPADRAARALAGGHPATGGHRGVLCARSGGRGRRQCRAVRGTARGDGGGLKSGGATVVDGCAPFVLFGMPDAERIRNDLHHKRIAVRRCDTFVGLGDRYLRAAVRAEWPRLVQAIGCWHSGRRQ
ncbi:aminotransferase class I and II family protein [Mycobacterium kansasii 732]|nr:aminotransferase class I and II family protein [Mycobacterium kansasii 732]